jgi:putative solute:sodium symporter small subunit
MEMTAARENTGACAIGFVLYAWGMVEIPTPSPALKKRQRRLTVVLLLVWAVTSFGPGFFARSLSFEVWGWPFHFWMAAQGSILIFLAIVVVYAWLMNRWEAQEAAQR